MNHLYTNLRKAFKRALYCAVILLQITGCGNSSKKSETADTPVFIGDWKIKSIRPIDFDTYEPAQKKTYVEQMNMLLDSSYAHFDTDSSYEMLTGDFLEKGKWLLTQKRDKLVLKSGKSIANRFLILEQNTHKLRIQNIDTKDSLIMELERKKAASVIE